MVYCISDNITSMRLNVHASQTISTSGMDEYIEYHAINLNKKTIPTT
jgi:hypothetical protein